MNTESIVLSPDLLAGSDIDPRWATGPFMGIKLMSAKGKGKRFEQIASSVFTCRGMQVSRAINSDHDRIVDGRKFEIKGSTITKGTDDVFSFLQIRPAQDYEFLILETFWFDGTIMYHRIPKSDIALLIDRRVFKPQHGGSRGNSGTFCYNGDLTPFQQYAWFNVVVK